MRKLCESARKVVASRAHIQLAFFFGVIVALHAIGVAQIQSKRTPRCDSWPSMTNTAALNSPHVSLAKTLGIAPIDPVITVGDFHGCAPITMPPAVRPQIGTPVVPCFVSKIECATTITPLPIFVEPAVLSRPSEPVSLTHPVEPILVEPVSLSKPLEPVFSQQIVPNTLRPIVPNHIGTIASEPVNSRPEELRFDGTKPKEPFSTPIEPIPETPQSNTAIEPFKSGGPRIGIGIGVGQLTIPKSDAIRPINEPVDPWNSIIMPNRSVHFESKNQPPAETIPSSNLATTLADSWQRQVLDDFGEIITANTVSGPFSSTSASRSTTPFDEPDQDPRGVSSPRRIDLGRYYLWPNQDGWVVFPLNGRESSAPGPGNVRIHERILPIDSERFSEITLARSEINESTTVRTITISTGMITTSERPCTEDISLRNESEFREFGVTGTKSADDIGEKLVFVTAISPVSINFAVTKSSSNVTKGKGLDYGSWIIGLDLKNSLGNFSKVGGDSTIPEAEMSEVMPVTNASDAIRTSTELCTEETSLGDETGSQKSEVTAGDNFGQEFVPVTVISPIFNTITLTQSHLNVAVPTKEKGLGYGSWIFGWGPSNISRLTPIAGKEQFRVITVAGPEINGSVTTSSEATTTSEEPCETDKIATILAKNETDVFNSTDSVIHFTGRNYNKIENSVGVNAVKNESMSSEPMQISPKPTISSQTQRPVASDKDQGIPQSVLGLILGPVPGGIQRIGLSQNNSETPSPFPGQGLGSVSDGTQSLAISEKGSETTQTILRPVVEPRPGPISVTTQRLVSTEKGPVVSSQSVLTASTKLSPNVTVAWATVGVDEQRADTLAAELAALNCTQRQRQMARRLAPHPGCDCAPGTMRDTAGACRHADVATFRARLTRLCGSRSHLEALAGDAQVAIVFSKLAVVLPGVPLCVRQSAGALVIFNALCVESDAINASQPHCVLDELQSAYNARRAALPEVDVKIAELEESACYQETLNDCDPRIAECVPMGLHYECECLANQPADNVTMARCRDVSYRHTCVKFLGVCAWIWILLLLLLFLIPLVGVLFWTALQSGEGEIWKKLREKLEINDRPRLPTSEYSAYAAIYRIMRMVLNLVDEEKLADAKKSRLAANNVTQHSTSERPDHRPEEDHDDEADLGVWLENSKEEQIPQKNGTWADSRRVTRHDSAHEFDATQSEARMPAEPSARDSDVARRGSHASVASSSGAPTLWDSYRASGPPPLPPLQLRERRDSSDSLDQLLREREAVVRARHAARANPAQAAVPAEPIAEVLSAAARKAEAAIRAEIEGDATDAATRAAAERPAHFRELPPAVPTAPPSSGQTTASVKTHPPGESGNGAGTNDRGASERRDDSGNLRRKNAPKIARQRDENQADSEESEHVAEGRKTTTGTFRRKLPNAAAATQRRGRAADLPPQPTRKVNGTPASAGVAAGGDARQQSPFIGPKSRISDKSANRSPSSRRSSPTAKKPVSPAPHIKRPHPRSTPSTSEAPWRAAVAPTAADSTLADLAELPISLSYPSLRDKYAKSDGTARKLQRNSSTFGGESQPIPADRDPDLPGRPYARPAQLRAKAKPNQTPSPAARCKNGAIRRLPFAADSARSAASSSTHGEDEMSASARERMERLRANFEERVHAGCLKNRPAWDRSPARSDDGASARADERLASLGAGGGRFGGSQLSLTGLEMRRTRSEFGATSRDALRGGSVARRPVGQRRIVTFDETSIEIGERSRSTLDAPRRRVVPTKRSKNARASIAVDMPKLARHSADELAKQEAIRATNAFEVSAEQKHEWLTRLKDGFEAKSWLDYD